MSSGYTQVSVTLSHESSITAAAFSPNALFLATASADGGLYIWKVEDCELVCSAVGDMPILSISWMQTADMLVYGTESGNLASCAFSPVAESLNIVGYLAHGSAVNSVSLSGHLVASAAGRELRVWEWRNSCPWHMVTDVFNPSVDNLTYAQDREVLITTVIWAAEEGQSGLLVATYLHEGIFMFETETWSCVRSISLGGLAVSASLSSDFKLLAVLNLGVGFEIFSMSTYARLRTFAHVGERRTTASRFLDHDTHLVCGSGLGEAHVWDIRSGHKSQILSLHAHDKVPVVDAIEASSGRSYIATGVSDEISPYVALWVKGKLLIPTLPTRVERSCLCSFAELCKAELLHDVESLCATATVSRKTNQAECLALVVNSYAQDVDYSRDCCKLLEDELAMRLELDPYTLENIMPFKFRD
ncbi:WD40 repeat-like protein [Trametes meyenii]|nr:WD40 repeat-like protein [Trametes meyenii]